jgi:hypothetical protein
MRDRLAVRAGFGGFVLLALPLASVAEVPGPDADGRYSPWEKDGVLITVHRTMSHRAAENSIEAIRECYRAGGDAIDCDLRQSLEGVLVTLHDPQPQGLASLYPVSALTYGEIRDLDLQSDAFPGQKIPRFEDVVRHAVANNMAIYLDEKARGTKEKAVALLDRYRAKHLILWPRRFTVYTYGENKDHDISYLRERFGTWEGSMKYVVDAERGQKKILQPGDPRHVRCDNPVLIAALAGRRLPLDRTRGPYRPPVPEIPDPHAPPPPPFETLKRALSQGGHAARLAANPMCANYRDKALALFIDTLRQTDRGALEERIESLWGLGQIGDASGLPLLRSHLASTEPKLRELSAYGLGRLRDAKSKAALTAAGQDPNASVARAARWALNRLIPSMAPATRPAADRLIERMLKSDAPNATLAVVDAPDAIPALSPMVKKGKLTPAQKKKTVTILALHPEVDESTSLLTLLSQDEDPVVAREAEWALAYKRKAPTR